MKNGYLSQYFSGVIAKRLSAVEADRRKSNQHEFNGVAGMKNLFGKDRKKVTAKFIYLDDDNEAVSDTGFLTWYDARENHPTRSEYRLFFPTTAVSRCAAENDVLFIGLRPDDSVLVVIAAKESTIASQLVWLFGVDIGEKFSVSDDLDHENNRLEYASKCILEQIGVEIYDQDFNYLDEMLTRFSGSFPTTKVFSEYARSTLTHVDARDNPDEVLMLWLEREEILFRTLEKHLIEQQLAKGFADVDSFISYSLSVQNRRKSRVGQSLENHFETLLRARGIRYDRTKVTENRSKPDFIFPGIAEYHDPKFDASLLTMLGAKSTCKDRWRQVLAEADRIENKHLLTLEAAISTHQTDEMKSKNLQLVIPRAIHKTYTPAQQAWLMDVISFMHLLKIRQING